MKSSKALNHILFTPMRLNEVVFDVLDALEKKLGLIILIEIWPKYGHI
jgi:hypothetical protein